MADKRKLIIGTGLSGLVGSRIVKLLEKDFQFENLDLTAGIDITSKRQVDSALKKSPARTVLHLAAFTDVGAAYKQDGDKNGPCYRVNVLGTKNIAEACSKYKKYLIHISTDFIFDGSKKGKYYENDLACPIEWYGRTKYWAEEEVKKSGCQYLIARIAYPFKATLGKKPDVVHKILISLKKNKLNPMFTDALITPTFIDDIAKVLKIFIQKKPRGVYHLVGTTAMSPFMLARKIARTFGYGVGKVKEGSLTEYLKKTNRPYQRYLALSNDKLKKRLGVRMRTFDEALVEIKKQNKKLGLL